MGMKLGGNGGAVAVEPAVAPPSKATDRAERRSARAASGTRKAAFDYFGAFNRQVAYCEEIVQNLKSALDAGEVGSKQLMNALHVVENDADSVDHDIRAHLVGDLIVPIDRDALQLLAGGLEDATDAIEEIAIAAYIYGVDCMRPPMRQVLDCMVSSVALIRESYADLSNGIMRKDDICRHLDQVKRCETECDAIFIEAMHTLYAPESSVVGEERQIMAEMYRKFEDAMDALERVAIDAEVVVEQLM